MKKLFILIALTSPLFYSCGNDEQTEKIKKDPIEENPIEKPNVYIAASSSTVDASAEFTIYSDRPAEKPITINVFSQNDQILTITDSYVTIEKGAKEVKGKFRGTGEGKTILFITSKDANIGTGSVEVTIGKALPKLSISAEKVDVDDDSEFYITSDMAAEEPITVSITSSDNTILSVSTPTLTIAKGEKTVKGNFRGLKKGIANLVIAANNVNIIKEIHEVTVGDVEVNSYVILNLYPQSSDSEHWINSVQTFRVYSNKPATSKITVNVTSSNEKVIRIIDKTVNIWKKSKVTQGTYKVVGGGKAKITISTSTEGVTIEKSEIEITVTYPTLISCDADNFFAGEWFANETSEGFTLWYNNKEAKYERVYLENYGTDYYGKNLTLTPVEYETEISTLPLTKNPEHLLIGTNQTTGYNMLPTFTESGTYYVVFNIADGVYMYDDPADLTFDKVAQKTAWALVTVTITENKASEVVLHDFRCPATVVGE